MLCGALKMKATYPFRKFVPILQMTRRYVPEYRNLNIHSREDLKPHVLNKLYKHE
jgi:hypothetical protein